MDFDKLRLATSVTNRILNTYDAIRERRALPQPAVAPSNPPLVPDPTMTGAGLDMRLEASTTGAATPAGDSAAEAALTGGVVDTPLEGLMTAEGASDEA